MPREMRVLVLGLATAVVMILVVMSVRSMSVRRRLSHFGLVDSSSAQLQQTGVGDEDLVGLSGLSLTMVDLRGNANITDAGLLHIDVDGIQILKLAECNVSDMGMVTVGRMKNLVFLDISNCKITDKGLEHLAGCSALKTLIAADTHVDGSSFGVLRGLALESLVLDRCPLDSAGLEKVSALPNLITLSVEGCSRVDRWDSILQSANLRNVNLSNTAISERVLGHLVASSGLIEIECRKCEVSSRILSDWIPGKNLRRLDLRSTDVDLHQVKSVESWSLVEIKTR